MEVVGLWRYPVKSLQGEPIDPADVEADGIAGDRQWGLRDQRTGRILTARRRPELLAASAFYDASAPVMTHPTGETLVGPGPESDRALSEWLASPVSLVPSSGRAAGRAEYFADATDDAGQAIEWTMPPGRYVDAAPILVLTTVSLRIAAGHHPAGVWDPRRFRPNILIETDGDGWLEDSWIGHPIQIGTAMVIPTEPCVRCTMVTRPQPGLDADVEIFRTLARHHRGLFGVWSDVASPGRVSVGDRASQAASTPWGRNQLRVRPMSRHPNRLPPNTRLSGCQRRTPSGTGLSSSARSLVTQLASRYTPIHNSALSLDRTCGKRTRNRRSRAPACGEWPLDGDAPCFAPPTHAVNSDVVSA